MLRLHHTNGVLDLYGSVWESIEYARFARHGECNEDSSFNGCFGFDNVVHDRLLWPSEYPVWSRSRLRPLRLRRSGSEHRAAGHAFTLWRSLRTGGLALRRRARMRVRGSNQLRAGF